MNVFLVGIRTIESSPLEETFSWPVEISFFKKNDDKPIRLYHMYNPMDNKENLVNWELRLTSNVSVQK